MVSNNSYCISRSADGVHGLCKVQSKLSIEFYEIHSLLPCNPDVGIYLKFTVDDHRAKFSRSCRAQSINMYGRLSMSTWAPATLFSVPASTYLSSSSLFMRMHSIRHSASVADAQSS